MKRVAVPKIPALVQAFRLNKPVCLRLAGLALLAGLSFALTACLPLLTASTPTPAAPPTETLLPPTETPTTIWFPPTVTHTPYPTRPVTPTPDLMTGLGDVIITDTFTTADNWQIVATASSRVALSRNELTIAISGSRTYVTSVRSQPVLGNFYLEITASPNLCRDSDEFGLLLRVSDNNDYYRFSLTCGGQSRLDRIVNGEASSPQPWTWTTGVPLGAPNSIRLAVWAVGSEMRFFANNEYLYTVRDPLLPTGAIGIFARSSTTDALTVNFSDLVIRQVTSP